MPSSAKNALAIDRPSPARMSTSRRTAPDDSKPAVSSSIRAGTRMDLDRFAELALACVHREYPHGLVQVLSSDRDAVPPRIQHPTFHGCYDWHSAVHAHWLLARFARLAPGAPR